VIAIVMLASAALSGAQFAAAHAPPHSASSASLRLDQRIGPVWIDESYERVQYVWGNGSDAGGNCGNGVLEPHTSFSCRRYRVTGGFVWVGVARRQYQDLPHGRVVFLETTSDQYTTADGVGVGFRSPYGKTRTFDGLRFHYKTYANFPPAWERRAYPKKPRNARCGYRANSACLRWERNGRVTDLLVRKGVVTAVMIQRGDFWYT